MELEPNQPQEKPKPVTETPIPQTDEETKPEASGGTEDGPNVEEKEEEEEASTGTVMTAAQKKAAKKEREKKKKKEAAMKAKQQQQKQAETEKEKGGTEIDSVAAVTDAAISEVKGQGLAAEESSEVKSEPMEGATGGDGDEGEGEGEGEGKEEGDDKKKKKKKKKKPEEEKKSKVCGHVATYVDCYIIYATNMPSYKGDRCSSSGVECLDMQLQLHCSFMINCTTIFFLIPVAHSVVAHLAYFTENKKKNCFVVALEYCSLVLRSPPRFCHLQSKQAAEWSLETRLCKYCSSPVAFIPFLNCTWPENSAQMFIH